MKKNESYIMELYRRLANVFEVYSNNIKSITITSNSDLENKTVVAKNYALVLAKSGKKTLFIDCNLPNHSKTKVSYNDSVYGLVSILESIKHSSIDNLQIKSYIEDTPCENLRLLCLGTDNLDRYSQVFKAEYLKEIIYELKKEFDCIIIDAPSLQYLSYTQIITSASDGCLFVLKEGVNEVGQGKIIKERLTMLCCKVLGCILEKEKKPIELFKDEFNNGLNMEYPSGRKGILTNNRANAEV